MQQLTLADFDTESRYQRPPWRDPGDRPLLMKAAMDVHVEVIYTAGDLLGRQRLLRFLKEHHYLHREGSADPNFTIGFGMFINGELMTVATFNPPAHGKVANLFGSHPDAAAFTLALTRFCSHPLAPRNSTSKTISTALRWLPRLLPQFGAIIAQTDLSVTDPWGRPHTGISNYGGANALYLGKTISEFPGFWNPATGAFKSRKSAKRTYRREDCPEGWVVLESRTLNNFLWTVGPHAKEIRKALRSETKALIRRGTYPVWVHPAEIAPDTPLAYPVGDKQLRAQLLAG